MKIQEIEIVVKDGKVEVRPLSGFEGTECLEATAALEEALGGQIVGRVMTAAHKNERARETASEQRQQQTGNS